jgi:dynein heavy chain
MMKQINIESLDAAQIEQVVSADEAVVSEKAAVAQAEKAECEALLAEAVPALNAALVALNTLKKADIDVVKTMKSPPAGVKLVMEAICVMKDVKPEKVCGKRLGEGAERLGPAPRQRRVGGCKQINDPSGSGKKILDYWGPAKKLLADLKFLDSLREVRRAVALWGLARCGALIRAAAASSMTRTTSRCTLWR